MNKIRTFSDLEINNKQIEHFFLYIPNGVIKVKFKDKKQTFCIYQNANAKYYIQAKGKNFYFDKIGQEKIKEYIENY